MTSYIYIIIHRNTNTHRFFQLYASLWSLERATQRVWSLQIQKLEQPAGNHRGNCGKLAADLQVHKFKNIA